MRRAFDAGLGRRICRFGQRRNNAKKMGDRWIMFGFDVSKRLSGKVGWRLFIGGKKLTLLYRSTVAVVVISSVLPNMLA